MRRIFMGTSRLGGQLLTYHLLVEEVEGLGENYGVVLEGFGQTACVRGVTVFQDQALALLEGLRRGAVTPVGLRDVVEDWLLA